MLGDLWLLKLLLVHFSFTFRFQQLGAMDFRADFFSGVLSSSVTFSPILKLI